MLVFLPTRKGTLVLLQLSRTSVAQSCAFLQVFFHFCSNDSAIVCIVCTEPLDLLW
jgi:hypothetical protein